MTARTTTVYRLRLDTRNPVEALTAIREHIQTPYWINILRFETPSRKQWSELKIYANGSLRAAMPAELERWQNHPQPHVRLLSYTRKRERVQ